MSEKTRIEIKLVLPGIPDTHDRCVRRLTDLLKAKEGIDAAHLVESSDANSDQLCIHFDPDQMSIGQVRELVQRAGADLEHRFGHLLQKGAPMHARQARSLESRVQKMQGVQEAVVSPAGVIRVEFDRQVTDAKRIESELRANGLAGVQSKIDQGQREITEAADKPGDHSDKHEHGGMFGERAELVFALVCGGLLLLGWLLSTFFHLSPWIPRAIYVAAYFFGGFFTFREAWENIRSFRLEIDLLMLVAAIGAAALGEWAEGALLLFLFSLGHALEHYAMGRAARAIEALGELAPKTAQVRRNGKTEEVSVDQLVVGDTVIVKPNERIAADGFVVKGESSVNQAPITGESVPVDKQPVRDAKSAAAKPDRLEPQFRVFAGTINGGGALEIQVTKLASESALARVVRMVNEAETQKSPTQQFTDRVERIFVPAVLVLSIAILFSWVVNDEPFRASFYRAMAVLVAASPCGLAISTPSAVLSGVARAAQGGVLVKGGGPLESLGTLSAIAFDKTGTLTEGRPRLTDVVATNGQSEEHLLNVAVAVETLSDHPLAAAVVQGGMERLKGKLELKAHDVQSITGRGVKAIVNDKTVYIGKDRLFDEVEGPRMPSSLAATVEGLKSNGRTTMIVRQGDSYLGVLGMMDTPRNSAKEVIGQLKSLGVKRMIMLSGDNQQVADAIAKQVGLDEAKGDLMPDGKVEVIKKLSEQEGVAMVGDGVNDAPALATATVGIAMGAAGSDVALETADVALMADDLTKLPFAVGLSRKTRRIIRQNLWFSLGMVAFLIPATVLGLQMGAAVLFHEGSTMLVVFNALRLLGYRDKSGT
jgi:Cd2+/Zn2+-exporting ATPase